MSPAGGSDDDLTYSVAWIDTLARGGRWVARCCRVGEHAAPRTALGRRRRARPLAVTRHAPARRTPSGPAAPGVPADGAGFNEAWYRKAPRLREGELQPVGAFFDPLDAVARLEPAVRAARLRPVPAGGPRGTGGPTPLFVPSVGLVSPTGARRSCPCSSASARRTPGCCRSRWRAGPSPSTCPSAPAWRSCSTSWTRSCWGARPAVPRQGLPALAGLLRAMYPRLGRVRGGAEPRRPAATVPCPTCPAASTSEKVRSPHAQRPRRPADRPRPRRDQRDRARAGPALVHGPAAGHARGPAGERRDEAVAALSAEGFHVTVLDFDAEDTADAPGVVESVAAVRDIDVAVVAFGVLGDEEQAWQDHDTAVRLARGQLHGCRSASASASPR